MQRNQVTRAEDKVMPREAIALPKDYGNWIAELKRSIAGTRQRALLAANEEQIRLYRDIGRHIP